MRSDLSMSALGRAVACAPSTTLPAVRTTSAWSQSGTDKHAVLRNALVENTDAPGIDMDTLHAYLDRAHIECEAAYAYNVASDTARFIGVDVGREYGPLEPYEIPGTCDVVIRRGDDIEVLDFKTGTYADEWQLRGLALALSRYAGVDHVKGTFAFLGSDGGWRFESYEYGPMELDEYTDELRAMSKRIATAQEALAVGLLPAVVEGDHCKYCPCVQACPAHTMALVRIAPTAPAIPTADEIEAADDETCARVWGDLERVERLVGEYRARLEARAAVKPIPLPDGSLVTLAPGEARDKIDDAIAAAVLTQRYGADAALAAASYSKTGITKALGASDGKAAIAAIRDAGGVTSQPTAAKVRVIKAEAKALPRKRGRAA